MAAPVFYQTLNMVGIDPTQYYLNTATAGGSVTPEYPAPPFIAGTRAFGSDGSEFIFVQASTTINFTDFVLITSGASSNTNPGLNPFTANSITSTNAFSSLAIEIGSAALIVKGSITNIPAGAYFWACTKGNFLSANTSGNNLLGTLTPQVTMWTTATSGILTNNVAAATTLVAFAGFTVVSSITITVPLSIAPPSGVLTNGYALGPIVSMNKVRTIVQALSLTGSVSQVQFQAGIVGW